MPTKRRQPKQRPRYPSAIEELIAGRPIIPSEEARDALVGLVYFGEHRELSDELRHYAFTVLQTMV
jgi:hypothetical protein